MSKPIVFKIELADCTTEIAERWRARSAMGTLTLLNVGHEQPNVGDRVACVLQLTAIEQHGDGFYGNFVVVPGDAIDIAPLFNLEGWAPKLVNDVLIWVETDTTADSVLGSLGDYTANVLGWSGDRGIITNGTLTAQFLKYDEEMGELATGVARHQVEPVVDAIGDCMVVLTNILTLAGINPVTLFEQYHLEDRAGDYDTADLVFHHRDLYNDLFDHITTYADRVQKGPYPGDTYEYNPAVSPVDEMGENVERALACRCVNDAMVECLDMLAEKHGVTLAGCFRHAWQQIRFRKGFLTPEGVFVKEE